MCIIKLAKATIHPHPPSGGGGPSSISPSCSSLFFLAGPCDIFLLKNYITIIINPAEMYHNIEIGSLSIISGSAASVAAAAGFGHLSGPSSVLPWSESPECPHAQHVAQHLQHSRLRTDTVQYRLRLLPSRLRHQRCDTLWEDLADSHGTVDIAHLPPHHQLRQKSSAIRTAEIEKKQTNKQHLFFPTPRLESHFYYNIIGCNCFQLFKI